MGKYAKSIIAVVGTVLLAVQSAISDDVITSQEWLVIATGALTAVGVFFFKNDPAPPV